MKLRPLRQRRRGRIEIIPMIDVMFFLLATFMLASLSLQSLHSLAVNLPRGLAPPLQVPSPVTLTVTRDGALLVNETGVTLETLPSVLRSKVGGREATVRGTSIVVAVDDAAPSGIVVQAMLKAREAGAERFLFAVSPK
jgi:biopolymer transport protein ExbD